MKILIIGSKGFIGQHAFDHFKSLHFEVLGCDVVTDYVSEDYIQIDATNSDYHAIFEQHKIDVCLNCSGAASVPLSLQNPFKDFSLNTLNVFKILEAIRSYQPSCKFINLSSAAVYGNPETLPIKENATLHPLSPYGIHKMQAEQILKEFHEYYNIATCSLRIFSAYGEGLKKQLFWDLYQKFLNNDQIELFGTGNESRDFIHVDDIVQAIHLVIQNAKFRGEEINIANGEEFTIQYVAELFHTNFHNSKTIAFNNQVKQGDPLNWRADISILKALGYQQNISIEKGIQRYIDWINAL
ncbi:NAD-dependent epimerase/dehydratase family protein [Flavobacterium sp.]|uniref:NAD-dependent epimerase/dehydratase family protein n=1 Tax=Flavobacterium sp. TaxID=239 RepID=UPI00286D52DC|nr:NAD-dependent epimerase/dehydratase family protein [Flavobacterium sp.]